MNGDRRAALLELLASTESTGTMTVLLCRLCAESIGLPGAEIMVASGSELWGSLASSDEISGRLGDLQYDLGEGPGVDAIRSGRPVFEPDLTNPHVIRWVAFTGPAVDAGAAALFSFPLRVGAARLGALDLYRDRRGPLAVAQHAEALFMAEVATEAVLAAQAGAPPEVLARELEVGANFHYALHQAAGMVAVQLGVGVGDALIRLRSYAFGNDRDLAEIAEAVVDRQLRFDPVADAHEE